MKLWSLNPEEIKDVLRRGDLTVCVVGLGGVGLAVAAVWLRHNARVIGVDVDEHKVNLLRRGSVPHPEEIVKAAIYSGVRSGKFTAVTDITEAVRKSD
ncbi:MAG: hypothetical protein J7L51_03830, partial [Desulfurococcales archaeon]|nr:hypothetical protein [Desulfurococcales archaeon]